ncbi:MAG: 3-oxoacyl-ACP synthase [Gelidibacter sp.]
MTRLMNSGLYLKAQLYQFCIGFVENRLQTVQNHLNEIQESLTSETKSSAGDKHETGRAMLQLEREKAGQQLAETERLNEALSKIDVSKRGKVIGLGSIVFTTQANYYISVSAGNITIDGNKFFAISPQTPIGQLLIGKEVDDVIVFRNETFTIREVL